jgi:translation initiation factor 1
MTMADNDWKSRLGMVYSTNPDFKYETPTHTEAATLPAEKQNLRVSLDRRRRAGKQVTLVAGFVGSAGDLEALAKTLKTRLGVGGAAKDGEIIIQGDRRDHTLDILNSLGYVKTKKI